MKYLWLLVVLLYTASAFPSQNESSVEIPRKTSSGGIGHFCQIGEMNIVTRYAACFDYCRLVEIKFGECPLGQVCCTTYEHIADVIIED